MVEAVDAGSVRRSGDRLAADATRLRVAVADVARSTAVVMAELAAGLERAAGGYRRLAQTNAPPGSEYYLQRAVQLEDQATRVRIFADREAREALRLANAPTSTDHLSAL